MDAALKAKWVEALRSGKYKQKKNYLRSGDGFCCLGVLTDISNAGNWCKASQEWEGAWQYEIEGKKSSQYFPWPLRTAMRISDTHLDPLMTMNDEGKRFSEIADWIEANL